MRFIHDLFRNSDYYPNNMRIGVLMIELDISRAGGRRKPYTGDGSAEEHQAISEQIHNAAEQMEWAVLEPDDESENAV